MTSTERTRMTLLRAMPFSALDLSTSARGREILGDWGSIDPVLAGAEVVWQ